MEGGGITKAAPPGRWGGGAEKGTRVVAYGRNEMAYLEDVDKRACFALCLCLDEWAERSRRTHSPWSLLLAPELWAERTWREGDAAPSTFLRRLGCLSGMRHFQSVALVYFCSFFQSNKINSIALPSFTFTFTQKSKVYL